MAVYFMKKYKRLYLGGIICICITTLFVFVLRHEVLQKKRELLLLSDRTFEQAVKKEMAYKMKDYPITFHYSSYLYQDSISWEEKNNWCIQSYITDSDINRICLDSVFHAIALQQNIQAKMAIRCKINKRTTFSCTDSSFYKEAQPLSPIIYRFKSVPDSNCELQAYISLSFWSLLKQVPSMGFIFSFWLLSIGTVFGIYFYWNKRRQAIQMAENTIVLHDPVSQEWEQLPNGLLLNEKSGKLKHEENIIELVENRLKLFIAFLRAPEYFLAHEEICEKVLERKIIDTLTISDREAAITTVKRLRKDLASISFIEIKSSRGKGYQLVFHESVNRL